MTNFFQANVYFLRKNAGLTQDEAAAGLGLKRSTVSNYETGHSEPDLNTILKIGSFFNVDVSDLLGVDLSKLRIAEKDGVEKTDLKAQVRAQVRAQVQGEKDIIYTTNYDQALKDVLESKLALKQQLIDNQAQVIESLKQANTALSSLTEAYKSTIERLQAEVIELKQKTVPQ